MKIMNALHTLWILSVLGLLAILSVFLLIYNSIDYWMED